MAPTCEECTGGVEAVSGIIGMESTIAEIMTFLKVKNALQTVIKSLKRNNWSQDIIKTLRIVIGYIVHHG